jgi:hypothetical protein
LIITFKKDGEDKDEKAKNIQLALEHFRSDSIHRIADSLSGLRFDYKTNKLLIIDSQLLKNMLAKKESYEYPTPVLEITGSEKTDRVNNYFQTGMSLYAHKDGYYQFVINIFSADAASSTFNLKTSVFVSTINREVIYIDKQEIFRDKLRIAKNESLNPYIFVPDSISFEVVYLWLRGTYQNGSKTKIYPMDEAYFFNVKANRFGTTIGEWKKILIKTASMHEK